MFKTRLGNDIANLATEAFEANFAVGQRTHGKALASHALLHAGDEDGVLRIYLAVNPLIEIACGAHFAAIIRQDIAYLTDDAAGGASWQPLHEIDLVGINVEGD